MKIEKDRTVQILENVIFLKKTATFSSMQTSDLRAIVAISEEVTFSTGMEIVRENELGDSMYIVKGGKVQVVKNIDEKQTVILDELSVGDCFGEMALFDAELRSASVYAKEPCVLLCVHSDDLNDLLLEYPTIAIEFIRTFVKRLRKANQNIRNLSSAKSES